MTIRTIVRTAPLPEGEEARYYPAHDVVLIREGLDEQGRQQAVDEILAHPLPPSWQTD